jgi:hypothetical protein
MTAIIARHQLGCHCTEALAVDGSDATVCIVSHDRDGWWCECSDPDGGHLCEHATALILNLAGLY